MGYVKVERLHYLDITECDGVQTPVTPLTTANRLTALVLVRL